MARSLGNKIRSYRAALVTIHIGKQTFFTVYNSDQKVIALCGAWVWDLVFKDEVKEFFQDVDCEACILLHWKETGEDE